MTHWLILASMTLLGLTGPAHAAPDQPLEWAALQDPAAQIFEDPFRALNPEQFDDLLFAVRLRGRLQQDVGTAEERQKWQDLLAETEAALAADQIDVDWLLTQREAVTQRRAQAAEAGNPLLDGQTVTLSGFAIPAPPEADGTQVVYLVPQAGMCSHLPPPAPNQMVRVNLVSDWTPSYLHEPVRLTGMLAIDPTEQEMNVVDGLMPMRATFRMKADTVVPFRNRDGLTDWPQTIKDRLGAAGNPKTGGAKVQD